jgi:hypothetical protein
VFDSQNLVLLILSGLTPTPLNIPHLGRPLTSVHGLEKSGKVFKNKTHYLIVPKSFIEKGQTFIHSNGNPDGWTDGRTDGRTDGSIESE